MYGWLDTTLKCHMFIWFIFVKKDEKRSAEYFATKCCRVMCFPICQQHLEDAMSSLKLSHTRRIWRGTCARDISVGIWQANLSSINPRHWSYKLCDMNYIGERCFKYLIPKKEVLITLRNNLREEAVKTSFTADERRLRTMVKAKGWPFRILHRGDKR